MKIQGANPDGVAKVCACGAGGRQSQQPSPAAAASSEAPEVWCDLVRDLGAWLVETAIIKNKVM